MNPSNLTKKFVTSGDVNRLNYLNALIARGNTHLIPEADDLFVSAARSINKIIILERKSLPVNYLD